MNKKLIFWIFFFLISITSISATHIRSYALFENTDGINATNYTIQPNGVIRFGDGTTQSTAISATDTNESVRVNNFAGTSGDGNEKLSGFETDGTPIYTADNNTGGEELDKNASDFYLFNNSAQIFFNGSALNITIDQLDDDTTYTAGSNLSLVGTTFHLNITDLQVWLHTIFQSITGDNDTAPYNETYESTFNATYENFIANANQSYVIINNLNLTITQLDTNVTTACGGADVLLANGTCHEIGSFLNDSDSGGASLDLTNYALKNQTEQFFGNINLTGQNLTDVYAIDFNITNTAPSHREGRLFYDSVENTLALYNSEEEVTLQIGQENYVYVRNNAGFTITNGQAVFITGNHGQNVPTIDLARADNITTASVVGVATHDIEDNSFGYITTTGILRELNTNSFAVNDVMYLSDSTAGALSSTRPQAPNFTVFLGVVIRSHASQGRVLLMGSTKKFGSIQEGAITFGKEDGFIQDDDNLNLRWNSTLNALQVVNVNASGFINASKLRIYNNLTINSLVNCQALNTSSDGTIQCSFDDTSTGTGQDNTNIAFTNQTNNFTTNQIINGNLTLNQGRLILSNSTVNSGNKFGFILGTHFTNLEEPVAGMIIRSISGANRVSIGGGSPLYHTATNILFFTGTGGTTLGGTERARFTLNGNFGINTQNPTTRLEVFGSGNFSGNLTIRGNITGANLNTTGNIQSSGFFLGDGSLLTGITGDGSHNATYEQFINNVNNTHARLDSLNRFDAQNNFTRNISVSQSIAFNNTASQIIANETGCIIIQATSKLEIC